MHALHASVTTHQSDNRRLCTQLPIYLQYTSIHHAMCATCMWLLQVLVGGGDQAMRVGGYTVLARSGPGYDEEGWGIVVDAQGEIHSSACLSSS